MEIPCNLHPWSCMSHQHQRRPMQFLPVLDYVAFAVIFATPAPFGEYVVKQLPARRLLLWSCSSPRSSVASAAPVCVITAPATVDTYSACAHGSDYFRNCVAVCFVETQISSVMPTDGAVCSAFLFLPHLATPSVLLTGKKIRVAQAIPLIC